MASPDLTLLMSHPSAVIRTTGAALPHPTRDPNPILTYTLHNLWSVLRTLIRLDSDGPKLSPPADNPSFSAGAALQRVGNTLVSILSLFYAKQSV